MSEPRWCRHFAVVNGENFFSMNMPDNHPHLYKARDWNFCPICGMKRFKYDNESLGEALHDAFNDAAHLPRVQKTATGDSVWTAVASRAREILLGHKDYDKTS